MVCARSLKFVDGGPRMDCCVLVGSRSVLLEIVATELLGYADGEGTQSLGGGGTTKAANKCFGQMWYAFVYT